MESVETTGHDLCWLLCSSTGKIALLGTRNLRIAMLELSKECNGTDISKFNNEKIIGAIWEVLSTTLMETFIVEKSQIVEFD